MISTAFRFSLSLVILFSVVAIVGCGSNGSAPSASNSGSESSSDATSSGGSEASAIALVHDASSESVIRFYDPNYQPPKKPKQNNDNNGGDGMDGSEMAGMGADSAAGDASGDDSANFQPEMGDDSALAGSTGEGSDGSLENMTAEESPSTGSSSDGSLNNLPDSTESPDGAGAGSSESSLDGMGSSPSTGDSSGDGAAAQTGLGSEAMASDGSRSGNSREAASDGDLSVRLTNNVALAQTTTKGTQIFFSTDYVVTGGPPRRNRAYLWVIMNGKGDETIVKADIKGDKGTLRATPKFKNMEGPYKSQIISIGRDRKRRPVSNLVTHN